jgi:succinyl-diaminopimelate desuccinylase
VTDLAELAMRFVELPSPSGEEGPLADLVESMLAGSPHLELTRVGDNLVARTQLGRALRVIVAGHLDTVSGSASAPLAADGVLWGLGAADMKGTLAVMAALALELVEPAQDVTWVFYAREEVARSESGLRELFAADPALLEGDVAVLGEPTAAAVEAGCQGTLRMKATVGGVAAHTARPYMGVNALRRLAPVLDAVAGAGSRTVEIDGVRYTEQCEPVGVSGGGGGNVVPSSASLVVNHRFAPDRTPAEAEAWLRSVIEPALGEAGDALELLDVAPAAAPGLGHPLLATLVSLSGRPVVAKVGWTDVATFTERGIPAANFGAGDPELAHHPDERVSFDELEQVASVLRRLLTEPVAS